MFFWPSPHSKVFPLGCFVLCMLLCACVFCTDWACYWVLPQVEPLCVFREVFGYSREVSERTVDLSNTWTATTPRAGRYSMDRGHLIYKEKKRLLRKKRKKKAPRGRLGKLGGDKRRKQNTFRPVTVRNEIVTGDTWVNTKKETGILTWSQNVSWFIFNMRKKHLWQVRIQRMEETADGKTVSSSGASGSLHCFLQMMRFGWAHQTSDRPRCCFQLSEKWWRWDPKWWIKWGEFLPQLKVHRWGKDGAAS